MILIITHKEDFTADYLIDKLNKKGIAYRRLNCEDLLGSRLELIFDPAPVFSILGCKAFHSVWFRRTKLPELPDLPLNERLYIQNEIESFLKGLFSIIDAKWLSDPFAVYKAEYKLLQLKVARQLGFVLPKTLLTNDVVKLKDFVAGNVNGTIIKPMDQTRFQDNGEARFIYTNELTLADLETISNEDLTPCIYQEKVPKQRELRVTIVADAVFAAATNSQDNPATKNDWRRDKTDFHPVELPLEIADLCKQLVRGLGLNFGAVDLIKTPDGQYIFLEINPNGQWAWIEVETGLPISDAIIDFLAA